MAEKKSPDTHRLALTIGQNVHSARRASHLSQDALAHALGFADGTHVSRIEAGTIIVRADTLQRIAVVLGVTTDHLLTENPTLGREEDSSD